MVATQRQASPPGPGPGPGSVKQKSETAPRHRPAHKRLGSIDTELDPAATSPALLSTDEQPQLCGPIRRVYYDDKNHFSVLTQLYGSVWPRVLPYCLAAMLLTLVVWYLQQNYGESLPFLTTDPTGHKFMAVILSFLVVTRANIMYKRFMEAKTYLNACYERCRELIQNVCVLTQHDVTEGARVWRHNVAYRTILLLRVTMAAIEYESKQKSSWEIPELLDDDKNEVRETIFFTTTRRSTTDATISSANNTFDPPLDLGSPSQAHGTRTLQEESFRAPLILAYNLRKEIMGQRSGAFLEQPFRHVNEELKMLDCVGDFITAFHGLQTLVTTPVPFPLVQMTRTFLFVFCFYMPFVLCHDTNAYPFEPLSIVFLITYGFLGLEYVCMELQDPFGDDPNDFDDLGMAQLVFEDIYIAIYKLDGEQAAHDLRRKIVKRIQHGPALENFQEEYQRGYSPVVDDTITFDRRAFYSEGGGSEDLSVPFRFHKKPVEVQNKKSAFRPLQGVRDSVSGSTKRFKKSLRASISKKG